MNLQPYQAASLQVQDQAEQPERLLRGAAGTTASLAGLGAVATRVLPFLNKYIPASIAMKGISKISPTLGKFIQGSVDQGHDQSDVLDFIKNKISPEQSSEQQAPDQRNIIEQYSPTLYQFLKEKIESGKSPRAIAQNAKSQNFFRDAISKMEKDHKTNFEDIVESIFGGGQMAQQPQNSQPQQSQSPGSGQQALMSILQQIQKTRGG